jgi:hypothetical protein
MCGRYLLFCRFIHVDDLPGRNLEHGAILPMHRLCCWHIQSYCRPHSWVACRVPFCLSGVLCAVQWLLDSNCMSGGQVQHVVRGCIAHHLHPMQSSLLQPQPGSIVSGGLHDLPSRVVLSTHESWGGNTVPRGPVWYCHGLQLTVSVFAMSGGHVQCCHRANQCGCVFGVSSRLLCRCEWLCLCLHHMPIG